LTKSVNQLLTESKNLLKEAYQIGENVQVALLIDLIESIIQQKVSKVIILDTLNDEINTVIKNQKQQATNTQTDGKSTKNALIKQKDQT